MDLTTSTKPVSPLRIPPAQPIRKTRLWLYGEPAAENSAKNPELDRNEGRALGEDSEIGQDALGLANSANTPSRESFSPPTARVIHSSEVPQPFWEPDYPSRRFRPEEYEKDDSYYSPPPQFFSPPTSPNELSVKDLAEHEVSSITSYKTPQSILTDTHSEWLLPWGTLMRE